MRSRASASPSPSPLQSGPFCSHSVADAPPLAALMDAELCSDDKRAIIRLGPRQRFIVMHRDGCSHLTYQITQTRPRSVPTEERAFHDGALNGHLPILVRVEFPKNPRVLNPTAPVQPQRRQRQRRGGVARQNQTESDERRERGREREWGRGGHRRACTRPSEGQRRLQRCTVSWLYCVFNRRVKRF